MGEFRNQAFLAAISIAIVTSVGASSASAAAVYLNGAPLFFDNYENDVVASEPQNPQVGTWGSPGFTNLYTHVQDAVSVATVSGSNPGWISDPPTSAYQGNNFLRVYRQGSSTGVASAYFGTVTSPGSGSSVLTADLALYMPSSAGDYMAGISFSNNATVPYADALMYIDVGIQANGTVTYNDGVNNNPIAGIAYQKDKWQRWRIDYTLRPGSANDTYTITIDGVTSAPIAAINANGSGADGPTTTFQFLSFRGDGFGAYFVDIPEPASASMGLLAACGMMLMRRCRHRRHRQ